MKKIAIIGAGELGCQILNLILQENKYEVIGFFDDTIDVGNKVCENYHVIGRVDDIILNYKKCLFDCIIIGIGYKHMGMRKILFEKYNNIIPFGKVIHPSCIIDKTAEVGCGTIIYPGCNIDKNAIVGENVLLNLSCVIAHDSTVGAHTFIAPGCIVSGFVKIQQCNFIGTGTIIIDNIKISDNNRLGAGTVVICDIEERGTYVGNPARKVEK